jgi:hypothetical protein
MVALQSISVMPGNHSAPVGNSFAFTADGTFSNGSTQALTSGLTWSSSNTTVATVDSTGNAKALATGTTTITVTDGGVSGSTTLTVTAAGTTPSQPNSNPNQSNSSSNQNSNQSQQSASQTQQQSTNQQINQAVIANFQNVFAQPLSPALAFAMISSLADVNGDGFGDITALIGLNVLHGRAHHIHVFKVIFDGLTGNTIGGLSDLGTF